MGLIWSLITWTYADWSGVTQIEVWPRLECVCCAVDAAVVGPICGAVARCGYRTWASTDGNWDCVGCRGRRRQGGCICKVGEGVATRGIRGGNIVAIRRRKSAMEQTSNVIFETPKRPFGVLDLCTKTCLNADLIWWIASFHVLFW